MFLFDVKRDFDAACKIMLEKNPELKVPWRFIAEHERYFLTVNRLCQQVVYFEQGAKTGRKTAYNRHQLIAAHAQLFVKFAIQHRDQSIKSKADLAKEQIQNRAVQQVQDEGIIKEFNHETGKLENIV
jgi:hypothetical protein